MTKGTSYPGVPISESTQHRNLTWSGGGCWPHCRLRGEAEWLTLSRYTPVNLEWESGETEFDKLGGELSVSLSVCLPKGSWGWSRQRGRCCLACQN